MTAPTPTTPRTAAAPSASSVKYTGSAGVREITAAQWKGAGVEGQKAVEWNEANEYTLPGSDFSPEALEVLKRDRNIKTS